MDFRCKIREMDRIKVWTRVRRMRHVGHKFKEEALTLGVIKVQAQDPEKEPSLNFVPCVTGSSDPNCLLLVGWSLGPSQL